MLIPSFCKPFPIEPNRETTRPLTGQIKPPRLDGGSATARDVLGAVLTAGDIDGNTALLRDLEFRFLVDDVEVLFATLLALPV